LCRQFKWAKQIIHLVLPSKVEELKIQVFYKKCKAVSTMTGNESL
jgi:hypothetical protein